VIRSENTSLIVPHIFIPNIRDKQEILACLVLVHGYESPSLELLNSADICFVYDYSENYVLSLIKQALEIEPSTSTGFSSDLMLRELFLHRFFRIGKPKMSSGIAKCRVISSIFSEIRDGILEIIDSGHAYRDLLLLRLDLKKNMFFIVSGSSSIRMFVPIHVVLGLRNKLLERVT